MMQAQSLPWTEPLELASGVDDDYWVLLYSSVRTDYSGRYSILARGLAERIEASDFEKLATRLSHDQPHFDNAWFGYLGYGLKNSLESLPHDTPHMFDLPDMCMMRFCEIYQFDHETKTLILYSNNTPTPVSPRPIEQIIPAVSSISSNMTREEYLQKAASVIEHIHAGDLYQANLTRKFNGQFAEKPNGLALFARLCEISPAPYSAYISMGDTHIISSSPELFLRSNDKGQVLARPIKGTAPRFDDKNKDDASRNSLAASSKDKAENLMIVDLMRNDMSKTCEAGSVKTDSLYDITSHATIHHMSSNISGRLKKNTHSLEMIKQCFPPGSMTGAPKIKAMKLCSALETQARGAYSGAIGWFGGDNSCELSVIIRTLVVKSQQFEFQVGGGIVADSTPELELSELLDKTKGICRTLKLDRKKLENL